QITYLQPSAAASSMIEVVRNQKKVDTHSRFRISAMTFMTSIGRSSRRIALLDEIECSFIDVERQPGKRRETRCPRPPRLRPARRRCIWAELSCQHGAKPAANLPAPPCNAGNRTDRHPQTRPDQR